MPVTATSSADRIQIATSGVVSIDDLNRPSDRSRVVLAALSGPTQIVVVHPGGTTMTMVTSADQLASPTAGGTRSPNCSA